MRPNVQTRNLKGEGGGVYIATGGATTGGVATPASPFKNFDRVRAIQDSIVTLVSSNITGDSLAGIPIPAGSEIYGLFTSVTVLGGAVVAHNQT